MKKLIFGFLVLAMMLGFADISVHAKLKEKTVNRVINVVYDDSGSMIYTNGNKVDTWCQAKYAMEVFASMLGEQDTMNIYVMSDFCNNTDSSAYLTMRGSDGAATNVEKVHHIVTEAKDTPFDAVRKAYSDLEKDAADEKWLVVLTDGEFQNVDDVNVFFSQKSDDVKVLFLGMGPLADTIQPDSSKHIYTVKAENNNQILNKITDICRHVFSSDKIGVNINNLQFSFDVPMKELVVFAQGKNVEIKGLIGPDGKTIQSLAEPVSVRYSEKATTSDHANYDNPLVTRGLSGSIATFSGDFVTGAYTVDVNGADTIEVYYKPNVELEAYLEDENGNQIKNGDIINEGEYTLGFGFVKAGTDEKVPDSYLLGIVSYAATVKNDGKEQDLSYSTGYDIELVEGDFHADVTTNYLSFNTISTSLDFKVVQETGLELEVRKNPEYILKEDGFTNDERPIEIQLLLNGEDIQESQWKLVDIYSVSYTGDNTRQLGEMKIEKSDEVGIIQLYPNLGMSQPMKGEYKNEPIQIICGSTKGGEILNGSCNISLNIYDDRGILQKNPFAIMKYVAMGLLVVAIVIVLVKRRGR